MLAKAASISRGDWAFKFRRLGPSSRAASSTSCCSISTFGAFGSRSQAMVAGGGTSSCSSSRRFGCRGAFPKLTPVILPPGRLRLVTAPLAMGSPPATNTIGIVEVAALSRAQGALLTNNHGHMPAYQVRHQFGESIELILCPAEFDRHVVAVDETGFL